DQDLQCAEHGRLRSPLREARFDDGVESSVGKAGRVAVPPGGNRHPHSNNLLALVVPGVELELGVVGDHAAQEAFENRVVVEDLGPVRPLTDARRVWEPAGPLGSGRKLQRHLSRSVSYARGTYRPPVASSYPNGCVSANGVDLRIDTWLHRARCAH